MTAFRLRKFANPDFLKTIQRDRLRTFFACWRDYFASRGLVISTDSTDLDCEILAHILVDPDASTPKDMIDALFHVHETAASDEDMDALLQLVGPRCVDIERDPNTTTADVAIQVWLVAPDVLRERHAEAVALRQKNFQYYAGANGGGFSLPGLDEELRGAIERRLDDWLEQHRRGRGCRVFFFPRENKLWILVRHGLTMRREPSQLDDGNSSTEFYRPQQHDVLIYDAQWDELGVNAHTKGERELYLSTFGEFLFGNAAYFPPADKFTLDPLLEYGAASLACGDVEGLEHVRLVEYRRYWGGADKEVEVRRATDIFAALSRRGQSLSTGGQLVSATFKVKFSEARKERSVTIRPPGTAKYERNEDSDLIETWLAKRGFILEDEVAGNEFDGSSELLARTG